MVRIQRRRKPVGSPIVALNPVEFPLRLHEANIERELLNFAEAKHLAQDHGLILVESLSLYLRMRQRGIRHIVALTIEISENN